MPRARASLYINRAVDVRVLLAGERLRADCSTIKIDDWLVLKEAIATYSALPVPDSMPVDEALLEIEAIPNIPTLPSALQQSSAFPVFRLFQLCIRRPWMAGGSSERCGRCGGDFWRCRDNDGRVGWPENLYPHQRSH